MERPTLEDMHQMLIAYRKSLETVIEFNEAQANINYEIKSWLEGYIARCSCDDRRFIELDERIDDLEKKVRYLRDILHEGGKI